MPARKKAMREMKKSVQIIILAAGNGKRMQSALPKALLPFNGEPMISRIIGEIEKLELGAPPVVVIGEKTGAQVKEALGNRCIYAVQTEQLGTGHAVQSAKNSVPKNCEHILVLYADHPLLSAETIRAVAESHLQNNSVITMATVSVPDFSDWRTCFYDYGRVVRGASGKIIGIVEKKDSTPAELAITEVNPSYFCFSAEWLWQNLPKIKNKNAQKEYYLTDLPKIAKSSGKNINGVRISPIEALGANTKEQFELLEKLARQTK